MVIGKVAALPDNSPTVIYKDYLGWIPDKEGTELLRKQPREAVK